MTFRRNTRPPVSRKQLEAASQRRILLLSLGCILGLAFFQSAAASAQETAASIIKHSDEACARDWAVAPDFDNSERDHTKDGDKTYADTMLFGSPYQRLIAINGHPLDPTQQKAEDEKYNKAASERQHESLAAKNKRIAKYQQERKRDHTLLEQMTIAFDFHLAGQQVVDGYNVYVLKATPREGYKPPNRDSQVLKGMEGTLWIDQKTFQWVKVEAHVTHPVRIEGFLAEVEPGTKFEFEKRPVSSDIWLASRFSMRANAKVMLLFPHRGQEDDSFFSYHKETTESAKNKQ